MSGQHSSQEIIAYRRELQYELWEQPFRLRDLRARMAALEEFAGDGILERSTLGLIVNVVSSYITLPECIAFHHREMDVYQEHVRRGEIDSSSYKAVRVGGVYGLCERWFDRYARYPYGDVRRFRPILGELLIEAADWERNPYPERTAQIAMWYEELAQGGAYHPSDEHLAYVERFEGLAEDIVWDNRDQEMNTIVNFPPPPNALGPMDWRATQHIVRESSGWMGP